MAKETMELTVIKNDKDLWSIKTQECKTESTPEGILRKCKRIGATVNLTEDDLMTVLGRIGYRELAKIIHPDTGWKCPMAMQRLNSIVR